MTIIIILLFFYTATLLVFSLIDMIRDAFYKTQFEKEQQEKWNQKLSEIQKNLNDD